MAKASKVIATKSFPGGGGKGGKGHMFGKQTVGSRKPGVTGKDDSGGGGKFMKGGKGHMFGKQKANPMGSGKTGK